MPIDPITIGLGAVTGLGNLFSNQSANSQRARALEKYRKKLIEAQYDPVEKAKAIDIVGDVYNTEMANAMNSSAFGFGKYLNSATAKAVSTSKMLGQRSGAMVDESRRIDEFNKKIDLDIAGLELQEPVSNPLGDLLEGGMAGVQLGMSIGNYQSELDWKDQIAELLGRQGGAGLARYRGRDLRRDLLGVGPRGPIFR